MAPVFSGSSRAGLDTQRDGGCFAQFEHDGSVLGGGRRACAGREFLPQERVEPIPAHSTGTRFAFRWFGRRFANGHEYGNVVHGILLWKRRACGGRELVQSRVDGTLSASRAAWYDQSSMACIGVHPV